jgi:hypothetical protein
MIQVARDDALGALSAVSIARRESRAASNSSCSGACVPSAASGGSALTAAGASFSSRITRNSLHEFIL